MADPIPQGSWLRGLNVERQTRIADGLAAALAISLPWSTSATSILALLWLIAVIPLLDLTTLRREISTPAGGFPVLLWVLGVIGMLWAVDVPFKERLGGLSSFHKLLFIPLLMIQFRRSTRGAWVLIGYLASCSALLVASWADLLLPMLLRQPIQTGRFQGVVVKDYIAQDMEFVVCAFLFAALAMRAWRDQRPMARRRDGVSCGYFCGQCSLQRLEQDGSADRGGAAGVVRLENSEPE